MFKISSMHAALPRCLALSLAAIALGLIAGCAARPLPAADLREPSWTIQTGQAVWRAQTGAPELAGDLLVATRPGEFFLQFVKTPFPLLTARRSASRWRLEAQAKTFGGRLPPPRRLWLNLDRWIEHGPPAPWHFESEPDGAWRFWNPRTGEELTGFLATARPNFAL